MTKLDPADGHVVPIDTFSISPERAQNLVDLLHRATEETMRNRLI